MTLAWFETLPSGQYPAEHSTRRPATDRGYAYGDGLFETIRITRGTPLFLGRHLRRLDGGLETLGLSVPWDAAGLARRCRRLCRTNQVSDGVLRLTVTRGPGPRGYEPPDEPRPALLIEIFPAPAPPPTPATAVLTPWRTDPASPLCRLKSLSALDKVLAMRFARQRGASEAIFHNTNGRLTEATASNLFIASDDGLMTPAETCGLLPGITRKLILESASDWGYPAVETEITREMLANAREAFLTNSVAGVQPLVAFEARAIGVGNPGPATATIAQHYERLCQTAAAEPPDHDL